MPAPLVLVTGATGTTGRPAVGELLGRGLRVRALVRTPAKAALIAAPGVEIAFADLSRPETLPAAFVGVDRLFLLAPADPQLVTLESNVIAAAIEAGVEVVVKVGAIAAAPDSEVSVLRWHHEVEHRLKQSGIPCTLLRPHSFMQNTLRLAPSIASEGVIRAPMADGALSIVDARDVAAVAAALLAQDEHHGAVLDVTGPEAVTYHDLARELGRVAGKRVRYVDVSGEEAETTMVAAGTPAWLAHDRVELNRLFRSGTLAYVTDVVERTTGRPGIPFRRFADDYAERFRT